LAHHRRALAAAAAGVLAVSAANWVRSDLQARESARNALSELESIELERALAEYDALELRRAADLAEQVEAQRPRLTPHESELVGRVRTLVDERIPPVVERALAQIAQTRADQHEELARAPWREFSPQPTDERARLMQAFDALRLAALLPASEHDPELQRARLTAASPRVSVRTDVPGARVSLRRVAVNGLGPAVFLGVTPIERAVVDPGAYRVVVEGPQGRFAELTRLFDRLYHDFELVAQLRSVEDVRSTMVRVPAGPVRYRALEDAETELREGVLEQSFWIERTEVSNAEYRRFVEATGHPAPLHWANVIDFQTIADLPVVAVRWSDALLFAEWSGKRLPTMLEWQVAARGPEGRLFPWGDDPLRRSALAKLADAEQGAPGEYFKHAEPVHSRLDGAGPYELLRTLDNVSEWCSDFSCTMSARPALLYDFALRMGGSFATRPTNVTLGLSAATETDKILLHVGLRCAKSEVP
jgi:formylglycine-generating enzyme required for sulfatase activity